MSGMQFLSRSTTAAIDEDWRAAGMSSAAMLRCGQVGAQKPAVQVSAVWHWLSSVQAICLRRPQVNCGRGSKVWAGGTYWQVGSAFDGRQTLSWGSQTSPSAQSFCMTVAHEVWAQ